jgi:hypothetical protein
MQRLQDPKGEVLAGFVQGGLGILSREHDPEADNFEDLQSLANVAFEPVWIFARDAKIKHLGQLKGLRVAIGAEGSGTRKVALDLLQLSGLRAAEEDWLALGGGAAAEELAAKNIDAVIAVAAPEAPSVQKLLHASGAHIVDLTYASAISRLLPYLQTITLPQGVLDLEHRIPPRDITLLTTSANLVVSHKLHPALAYLLLDAAVHVHDTGGPLNRPGEFPHVRGTDYPVSDQAKQYFATGKPFLQRYMPFWAANFVQRLLLILVPLIAVVLPLVKLLPQLVKFLQERKLFRLYGELRLLELDLKAKKANSALTEAERDQYLKKLAAVEAAINATQFGRAFADRVYTLRQHVDFVRGGLIA